MSATLNIEWLAWTIETPTKVYLHDKKIAEKCVDVTSIPLNPTKTGQLEEEEDGYKRRRATRPEKINGTTGERMWEESSLVFIL